MYRRTLLAVALLLLVGLTASMAWRWLGPDQAHAAAQPREAARKSGPLEGLDGYIGAALRDWEVPGLAIAVVKDDAVVLAKGYGVRKLGERTPVDEHTIFAIASCSKAFTAAALAMLVDEGKIAWDDPVTKHLRDFQLHDTYSSREITVRDLLCHRSGLPRYDMIWYASAASRDDILRRLRHAKPNTSFRSQFGYQNIMFLAAGQVLPAVAGTSWDEFVKARIFTPLGMKSSSTSIRSFRDSDPVATPHQRIDDKLEVIRWRNIDNAGPAGSINSTVADMAQWIRLQLGEGVYDGKRLLTSKAIRDMHTPQTVIRPEGMGPEGRYWEVLHPGSRLLVYGLGWVLREYRGRVLVQHGGSIDGMRSVTILVPEEKLGLVILTNRGGQVLPEAIGQRVLDAYLGAPPRDWSAEMLEVHKAREKQGRDAEKKLDKERIAGTKPSLALEKYEGAYRDTLYGDVTVSRDNGKLRVRFGPSLVGNLEHWHFDTFRATWTDRTFGKGLVTFRLNNKGEPDEVQLGISGASVSLTARRARPAVKEPAIALSGEELGKFVGVYSRKVPPLEVTVELLGDKLKLTTFGQPVSTLVPIKPGRFRVEGAPAATYLQFDLAEGKVKQVVLERGDEPKATLLPGK
jgi:CubicO group peptidase (beta-lactamase class C family)